MNFFEPLNEDWPKWKWIVSYILLILVILLIIAAHFWMAGSPGIR